MTRISTHREHDQREGDQQAEGTRPTHRDERSVRRLLLHVPAVLLGAAVGIGPFFEAFYRPGVWQPAALVTLLALAAAVVTVRRFPRGWALASLAGLTLLLA